MKKEILLCATTVAVAAVMAGCKRNGAERVADAGTVYEEVSVPDAVDRDVVREVTMAFGDKDVHATEIARVFKTKSPEVGMTVRVFALKGFPAVNNHIAQRIDSIYSRVTMQSVPVSKVGSADQLAEAIGRLGRNFTDTLAPQMMSTEIPGYNIAMDFRPVYVSDDYMTYSVYADYYLGGAHGDYEFYFVTLDPVTGEVYDFDALVKPEYRDKVRHMLVEAAAKADGKTVDGYLENLNEFLSPDGSGSVTVEDFPVYHVGVTGDGLVFCYPKYTIAPGSSGCPVYTLPMDKVRNYLSV